MKEKQKQKDRRYTLCGDLTPLTYVLPSRDTARKRLYYYNEEEGTSRTIRYAPNQKSIFIDEQNDVAVVEPIIFEDGDLFVPKEQHLLQEFLHYHPGNVANGGKEFYEFDPEKQAAEETQELFDEVDALIKARSLDLNTMMAVGRVYLSGDVDSMTTAELKRDILIFAKNNPREFLDAIEDPDLNINNIAARAIKEAYVTIRGGKDIFYNLKDNKKKILTIPFGIEPADALMQWLTGEDGVELFKFLTKEFE